MEKFPFNEEVHEKVKIRTFSQDVEESELIWHTDNEDRFVTPINENNWMLQIDNELPTNLLKGKKYYIPEGVYHRVIKGNGDLKVKIELG